MVTAERRLVIVIMVLYKQIIILSCTEFAMMPQNRFLSMPDQLRLAIMLPSPIPTGASIPPPEKPPHPVPTFNSLLLSPAHPFSSPCEMKVQR